MRPFEKIVEGLKEAIALMRGEAVVRKQTIIGCGKGRKTTIVREMTEEEERRFDAAMLRMDEAFERLDKAFDDLRKM